MYNNCIFFTWKCMTFDNEILKTGLTTSLQSYQTTIRIFYFYRLKMGLMDIVPPGVVTGDNLMKLMEHCRENQVSNCIFFVYLHQHSALPAEVANKLKFPLPMKCLVLF